MKSLQPRIIRMDDVEKLLCIQMNLQILSFYSIFRCSQALEANRRLVARRLASLPGTEDFRCKPGPVLVFVACIVGSESGSG
jgi:hypothetical protein